MGYGITGEIGCNPGNFTAGNMGRDWIVVHYTATMASAENNCRYFANNGDCGASAHYFVDRDGQIWASVGEGDTAWHAGNWHINCRSIGIECVSDGCDFAEGQIGALSWLVGDLMSRYGIDAGHVIRHYDVADHAQGGIVDPHKRCPAPYVDAGKWNELHARITGGADREKERIAQMSECIIWMDDDHTWKKGTGIYYNTATGFKGLPNIDCYNVLKQISPDIAEIHAATAYPWDRRLYECLASGEARATYPAHV